MDGRAVVCNDPVSIDLPLEVNRIAESRAAEEAGAQISSFFVQESLPTNCTAAAAAAPSTTSLAVNPWLKNNVVSVGNSSASPVIMTSVEPVMPDKPITFTMTSSTGLPNVIKGNSRMIIEAIDALRARKARPDEDRISHWVHRR